MLRATITALIISIGIMALVGILTAIDGMKSAISQNFSSMGANSFNIKNRGSNIHFGGRSSQQKKYRSISKNEALDFVAEYKVPSKKSVSINASFATTVTYESKKTDPNVMVNGADENYLSVSGYEIGLGRNFSPQECAE